MPRSSPPDLPIIGDELCEHILATPAQYDAATRALAREVLIWRAMAKALRAIVEAHDHGGDKPHAQLSYSLIAPGEVAEVLNRAAALAQVRL
jgi:hypothetical protein